MIHERKINNDVLTIVIETKTFAILANQTTLLCQGKECGKEPEKQQQNKRVHHSVSGHFPKNCFVFIVTFVREKVQSCAMIQIMGN